jgi:hypothetical protein
MPVPDQVRDDGSGIQSFFFWIPAFAGMTTPRQAAGNSPEGIQQLYQRASNGGLLVFYSKIKQLSFSGGS